MRTHTRARAWGAARSQHGALAVHLVERGHVLEDEGDGHEHERLNTVGRELLDARGRRRLEPAQLLRAEGALVRERVAVAHAEGRQLLGDELHAALHLRVGMPRACRCA